MQETHDGMGVTAGEFDALVEDLVATLNQFGVGKAEQDELLGALAPMRPEIVEVESPETGKPLPPTYQNAPPLNAPPPRHKPGETALKRSRAAYATRLPFCAAVQAVTCPSARS